MGNGALLSPCVVQLCSGRGRYARMFVVSMEGGGQGGRVGKGRVDGEGRVGGGEGGSGGDARGTQDMGAGEGAGK